MPDERSERPPRAPLDLGSVGDEVLPALMARFEASGLGELEVRRGEWRVRLRRDGAVPAEPRSPVPAGEHRRARQTPHPAPAGAEPTPPARNLSRAMVTSPAVGYYQPIDGLDIGRSVRQGDALGHVDVLGIRHDVVAPADGVVGRVLADPGEAVEYGQDLVRLDRLAPVPG